MRSNYRLVVWSLQILLDANLPMILNFRVKFGDLTLLLLINGRVAEREMSRR